MAATDVLPFSHVGGLVVGARTLTAAGVPDRIVYASMVADLTTEMAAQLLFTLGGVATLLMVLAHRPVEHDIVPLALAGVAGMVAIIIAFVVAQRPLLRLAGKLGARVLPGSVVAMAAVERTRSVRDPSRIPASTPMMRAPGTITTMTQNMSLPVSASARPITSATSERNTRE